jgi:PPM family protein phosphatase
VSIVAKSDTGMVRKQNQDSFATGTLPGQVFWSVVCDGMGGAAGGSVASKVAVEIISEKIRKSYKRGMSSKSVRNLLLSAIEGSNITIFDMANNDLSLLGMGTTVVVAIISDNTAYISHAGDSRAYLINQKGIRQLTKDHSVVQAMVENGELTPDQAINHPQKNIITRALGVDESISIDFNQEQLEENDVIIICTDGLSNFIDEDAIFDIFQNSNLCELADILVGHANKNGGGDNITVVAIINDAPSEGV